MTSASSAQSNKPTKPPETEPNLSRRQLLKILAASGGAAAGSTLLPERWVKPVIEAGVLPAHAQISGVTISNLKGEFTGESCDKTGLTEILTFLYHDPSGSVGNGVIIYDTYLFLPDETGGDMTFTLPDSSVQVIGDGFRGAIRITLCTNFIEGDTGIQETIYLANSKGINSNTLSVTLPVPDGAPTSANSTGHKRR